MNSTLLQPGEGSIAGRHLLTSTTETVSWGWLPNEKSTPCLTVASGDTVTIDTLSHEGILADQGRDPVEFLGRYGVEATDVLHDARAPAAAFPTARTTGRTSSPDRSRSQALSRATC
jgi:hypothetical protein